MANIVDELLGDVWYRGSSCQFLTTYDASTKRVVAVKINNDLSVATRFAATSYVNGSQLIYTTNAGHHVTQTLKNNQQFYVDKWSVSMLALV